MEKTAYELITRYEQIAALRNPSEIGNTVNEVKIIADKLTDYGIVRGQDNQGKFVWYDRNDQVITKEEVK